MTRKFNDAAMVPVEWQLGDVILDLYEVKQIHAGGGMGLVYRVHHRGWNVDLAAKSPRTDFFQTDLQKKNFIRECETWINLGLHPHIVSCYYVRTLGGVPRVFAEYVEGGSLKDWIDSKKLYEGGEQETLKRIFDIAIQMAWGLHYAHEKGLIHQDVKPANVLMMPDGTTKITDFGLAKARAAAGETVMAGAGRSILVSTGGMTPAYCSPEQANKQQLSRRTDIWSWGLTVLEMFAGGIFWRAGQAAADALQSYAEQGDTGGTIPSMPAEVMDLLALCFHQQPDNRPKNMDEVAESLRLLYHEATRSDYRRTEPKPVALLADGLNNRGVSLLDLGRKEDAEKLLVEALKSDPLHPEATFNIGLIRWRSARITDADLVRQLDNIRKTRGEDWRADYFIGLVHLERCDCDSAKVILAKIPPELAQGREIAILTHAASNECYNTRQTRVLTGKTDWVSSIALTTDGNLALTGSHGRMAKDHSLYLWDLRSGDCIKELKGHHGGVTAVDMSEDGRVGLSGGEDGTVRLWDVVNGGCLKTYNGHTDVVSAVCLSTNEKITVSGSWDQTLRVWDMDTGCCLRLLRDHGGRIFSVCIAIENDLAVSAGGTVKDGDFGVRLWRLSTGCCLHVLDGHAGPVNALSLTADRKMLLSCSYDKTLRLWDIATGRCIRVFRGHAWAISAACISPNGSSALSSDHAALLLWDVATGRCVRHLPRNADDALKSIQFTAGGAIAVVGGYDKKLTVWRLNSQQYRAPFAISLVTTILKATSDAVRYAADMGRAREAILTKDAAGVLKHINSARSVAGYQRSPEILQIWQSLYTWLPRSTLNHAWEEGRIESANRDAFASIDITSDGCFAISRGGFRDNMVRLWELSSRRCLREFNCEWGSSICLSADMRTALMDGFRLHLLEIATGRIHILDGHAGDISAVSISPDSRFGIAGHYDGVAQLWDLQTKKPVRVLCGHKDTINAVCFNSDGRFVITASGDWVNGPADATVRIWDVANGSCLLTLGEQKAAVMTVCVTLDDQHVLSGCSDGKLQLWGLHSGCCVRTFERHDGWVKKLCVSSDGRVALSGNDDGAIRFWDVSTGACLQVLKGHTGSITDIRLSADGRMVVSAGEDGTMRLWALDWSLGKKDQSDWHEGALPFLRIFLTLHTPYVDYTQQDQKPWNANDCPLLARRGQPQWTTGDFNRLLQTLGCAGYGWLRPDGVRCELEKMANEWTEPPPF